MLENTVNEANNSPHKAALKPRIKAAEDLLEELKIFNRLGHEILTMKQSTVSEMRSYSHPPVVVHHVMLATFLLLGEKIEYIEVRNMVPVANWVNMSFIYCCLLIALKPKLIHVFH